MFKSLKKILATPLALNWPCLGEVLYLYLVVVEEVVSVVLISEFDAHQIPKDRNGSLGVITTSPKLRRYLLTHFIIVQTYMTLKQVFY